MLEVSNLDSGYDETQVLFDLDLHVDEGETVAVIGPNGAGKSTLFRTISGTLVPMAGEIVYQGESIGGLDPSDIAAKNISHVPQEDNIFTNLTIMENLLVGSYRPAARERREHNLDIVMDMFPRLDERRDQTAGTLSGGERQMLAIARGLMADPDLLLLDEPSLGLAPNLVEEVFERINVIIEELGITIFLVEQRVFESLELADRAYVLENGRVQMEGPSDELMDASEIRDSYLGL